MATKVTAAKKATTKPKPAKAGSPKATAAKPAASASTAKAVTAKAIIDEIRPLGTDAYKKTMLKHGIREPFFGVKVEDMKKIQKRIKKDYQLALDLYDSGIYDAMYLAGLIADDLAMTREDIERWVSQAYCNLLSEYTVPWVAAQSRYGRELALRWIDSKDETRAAAGWGTLRSLVGVKEDAELDMGELKQLLQRVEKTIHQQPNRVRYVMNTFVIALGSSVKSLTKAALQAAARIGPVSVDMGGTACEVPDAAEYIRKVEKRGSLGKKRESTKC